MGAPPPVSEAPVEIILVPRDLPATPGMLALMRSLYPEPCERRCWHSSCATIRDLERRLEAGE